MDLKPPTGRLLWGDTDVEEILGGMREPLELREIDRKGLGPVSYAALKAADRTRRIEAQLEELISPPQEGEDRIAALQAAVEAVAEAQIRLEGKLDALLRLLTDGASSTLASSTASGAPTRPAASASTP